MEENHDYCEDNNIACCIMGYLGIGSGFLSKRQLGRTRKSEVYSILPLVLGDKCHFSTWNNNRHNRKRCVSAVL